MARNCTLTPHSWLDKLGEIKDELVQMYGDNSVTNIEENNAIMDQSTEDDPDYKNVLKAVKSMTAEDLESFKGICYSDKDLTNDKGVELNDSTKLHNIASKIASWILQEREVRNPRLGGSDSRLYGTLPTSSILAGIFDDIYFIYGNNEKTRAIRNALLKLNSFISSSTLVTLPGISGRQNSIKTILVLFVLLCRYPIFSSSVSAFFNCSSVPSASINKVCESTALL